MVIPYQLHGLHGAAGQLESVEVADLDGHTKHLPADVCCCRFSACPWIWAPSRAGEWHWNAITWPWRMPPAKPARRAYSRLADVAAYAGKLKLILQGFSEAAMAAHAIHPIVFPDTALHFEYSTTKGVPA